MCVNSCILYYGPEYGRLECCPVCNAPRMTSDGKTRQHMLYFPFTVVLVSLLNNPAKRKLLRYRSLHTVEAGDDALFSDVYDGINYRKIVEAGSLPSPDDMLLSLSFDGFQPFKKTVYSCLPIVITNLNFPPQLRAQSMELVALVPGPHEPGKLFDSFLLPLIDELKLLENGVPVQIDGVMANFEAHLAFVHGDSPALSKCLGTKGSGGIFPCRVCPIKGVPFFKRDINGRQHATYYYPLSYPRNHPSPTHPGGSSLLDVNIHGPAPSRTRESILRTIDSIMVIKNNASLSIKEKIRKLDASGKETGISNTSSLFTLKSINLYDNFPVDMMHLFWCNLGASICNWYNASTNASCAAERWCLPPSSWIEIDSKLSCILFPSGLSSTPRPLASNKKYKACDWKLFMGSLILPLLFEFLPTPHLVALAKLINAMNICSSYKPVKVEDYMKCSVWITEFLLFHDEHLYQKRYERLPMCPANLHQLLHFVSYIIHNGPAWSHWQFGLESLLGRLSGIISSGKHPMVSLANSYINLRNSEDCLEVGMITNAFKFAFLLS